METTPGKRILIWREFKGMTPAQMIKATGIKRSTLDSVEDPNGSKPSHDTLMKVVKAFPDLNAYWLLTGEGEMLADGRTLTPIPTPANTPETEPDTTQASKMPADYGTTVELAITRARVADRDETIMEQAREIARLNRELGKPFNGLDAAGSPVTPTPRNPIGFGAYKPQLALSVSYRVKSKGAARPL